MNKEDFLKAIMELPKVEANNPISTMNGINVEDLMSAIDRLNKVPDYNDLLKENQELKQQLEEKEDYIKKLQASKDKLNKWDYENTMKQKEFIKYLEDEIKSCELVCNLIFNRNKDMKIYKEILNKYREIIGGKEK